MTAVANARDENVVGPRVNEEWPELDIHRDYDVEYLDGPEQYEAPWNTFLSDPAVPRPASLYQWKRIIVKTPTANPLKLLDLAVYPDQRLVVFIKHPSDQLLQPDTYQRQLSEVMYQSLRGINPDNSFIPNKFLFPDPPERSQIGMAAWKAVAEERPQTGTRVLPEATHGLNPRFLEIIGTRPAAPISYMIARHPGAVAGPVSTVMVVKGPLHGHERAVLIMLGPN